MITKEKANQAVVSKLGCVVDYYVKNYSVTPAEAYRKVTDCYVTKVLKDTNSRLYLEDINLVLEAYEIEQTEGVETVRLWLQKSIGG